jgi:2-phosphosulfolactate phosphatase
MQIEAVLYPGQFEDLKRKDLGPHTAVVFDVMRATSTALTALVNGAALVIPVQSLEEALEKKMADPSVLLGGERNSFKPEKFDLGNSPLEYTPQVVRGRRIIHTTTNGTLAIDACLGAGSIYLGTLLNLSALAQHLLTLAPGPLTLVCAGTHSHFALEDGIAAGALVAKLLSGKPKLAPSARACLSVWRSVEKNPAEALAVTRNARRLKEIGLTKDVEYCSQFDAIEKVAKVEKGEARLV